jgi:hypothetical protein
MFLTPINNVKECKTIMDNISTDTIPQLQNWNNFCQYHANSDWHGIWTRYTPNGQVIESFQCVRSFHISEDKSEINHQNHYLYADGTKETKTFGPYKKPITRALFLDNSFSWGSTKVESGSNFGFETGFRYKDRRVSVAITYGDRASLENIIVISEHLSTFASAISHTTKELSGSWEGTAKTITPDWIVSSPVATSFNKLENLSDDYQILHLLNGISIACPHQIETGKEFVTTIDWLVNPDLLQRGIRKYDASSFTSFTLEIFNITA